jgi:hypothetical protein
MNAPIITIRQEFFRKLAAILENDRRKNSLIYIEPWSPKIQRRLSNTFQRRIVYVNILTQFNLYFSMWRRIYLTHISCWLFQVAPSVPFTYYLPLHLVYVGISTQVNGMAMDWLSGSLYWTDALYNWITVADAKSVNVFNHIIVTDLFRPQGIAVYPQKGCVTSTNHVRNIRDRARHRAKT